jgi:hypothetical protein
MTFPLVNRKRVSFPMEETSSTRINEPRRGDWCQTFTGVQFFPLDPRPREVHLIDIAVALSNLCRFGGHVWPFYPTAQHCVLVAMNSPAKLRKQALLHDAAEAYIVDVPRPLKRYLINYDVVEARLAATIGDRFGVELCSLDPEVHHQDNKALATEKRDLLVAEPAPWAPLPTPWMARIVPWSPTEARENFLGMAAALGIR